jgi:ribosomal protein S18 acetylase RimI-like enzyme
MTEITLMKKEEVESVAKFISEMNSIEGSHIGYCGQDCLEIAHSLREDITDITYNNSFLTVYDQGKLVGVLGFNADLESGSAEVWGPFFKEDKWDIVTSVWGKMIDLLPNEINSINMFPNKKNKKVLELVNGLSFHRQSDQTILNFSRSRVEELEDVSIQELTEDYHMELAELHNNTFPNTYYSGHQIINRLNEDRKVFIIVNDGKLCGYIYVEAKPDYGEASIEFFAVKERERGKGIGGNLLTAALKWLFTIESIGSITLCVNSSNQDAINLYKKVGFQLTHELCFFTKKL